MKRQATDWKKVLEIHIFNRLTSGLFKDLLQISKKKADNSVEKQKKRLEQALVKEDIQIATNHRCSGEIQSYQANAN